MTPEQLALFLGCYAFGAVLSEQCRAIFGGYGGIVAVLIICALVALSHIL